MKKSILTLLILFICAIQSTTAYEYFTIYFSDGTKSEAFYATDVDSICYSKLSLDSIAYDDWQVQEIYTCDSVYRYPLAQIDSLSFKDVNEDVVSHDIALVSEAIMPMFHDCHSALQLGEHLSAIQSIDGVEDAYISNQTLFVKIRDWGYLSFIYPIDDSNIDGEYDFAALSRNIKRNRRSNETNEHQHTEALKACFVNQQYCDENRKFLQTIGEQFCVSFASMGIDTITINMPYPEFFKNDMFNYDILFIKTHGDYEKKSNLHWIFTGEELFTRDPRYKDSKIDSIIYRIRLRFKHLTYSPRKMSFSWIGERRNGDSIHVLYITISDH